MPPYPSSTSAYRANQILTASSPQLIVMLYDGARRFLLQAAVAMADHDVQLAHNKLRRAEHVIRHLRNTVDLSHGEVAANLHAVYDFWLRHVAKARFDQDPAKLQEVAEMVGRLRTSWASIADAEPQDVPVAAGALVG